MVQYYCSKDRFIIQMCRNHLIHLISIPNFAEKSDPVSLQHGLLARIVPSPECVEVTTLSLNITILMAKILKIKHSCVVLFKPTDALFFLTLYLHCTMHHSISILTREFSELRTKGISPFFHFLQGRNPI